MPEEDADKEDLYIICPFCQSKSYTSWSDRELSDWTIEHIKRQTCRK